jgi:acetylornithine deacetylase/succinyl-diaminopimelate desuccinylase-like protein
VSTLGKAAEILGELVMLKSTAEDDIKPIVDYVSDRLKRIGLEPRYHNKTGRPAIIAQYGKAGVLLSGHLDTVPHGADWDYEDGDTVKGKMYGRGACDMKGGCAAILVAAEGLVATDVPFSVCFTTDEETGMKGAEAAAKDEAMRTASAILVAEPTGLDLVVREKGLLQFSLKTKGVSAHASMPERGENAITKMTRMLCALEDLTKTPHDTLASLTMCIDMIRGGTQINVIPSECVADIDTRYPAGMTSESVLELVRKRIGKSGYDLKIIHQLDPVETSPELPAVKILKEVVGTGARLIAVPYATEMVMFKGHGNATMVCGPGNPNVCHCADEHIDVSEVTRAVEIYVMYCTKMAARGRNRSGVTKRPRRIRGPDHG